MDFTSKKREREPVSINLTSLIDVVLLLLIFFMISTTFILHPTRCRSKEPRKARDPGKPEAFPPRNNRSHGGPAHIVPGAREKA